MAPFFEGFQESSIFRAVSQVTCRDRKKSQSLYLIGCDFRRGFLLDGTNMQKKHIPISSMRLFFALMVDYGKLVGKCAIRGCYGTFFSGPLKSGKNTTHKKYFNFQHSYVFLLMFPTESRLQLCLNHPPGECWDFSNLLLGG